MHPIRISAALLASAGLLIGTAAAVPATAGQGDSAQLAQAAGGYTEEKLQSFAMAALEVAQVREEFSAELADADSEERRQEIALEANETMIQAVEAQPGITVDEYNQIAQATERAPALSQRIAEYMAPHMQ